MSKLIGQGRYKTAAYPTRSTGYSPNPGYSTQAAWFIDPVNGNDSARGSTTLTAIKTWREFARRVNGILGVKMTVTFLSSPPASDPIRLAAGCEPDTPTNFSDAAGLIIMGQMTTVATGTVTAAANADPATNTAPLFEDTARADPWVLGERIEVTSGDQTGTVALVAKDLTGGQARVHGYVVPGGAQDVPPDPGSAYRTYTLTHLQGFNVSVQGGYVDVYNCRVDYDSFGVTDVPHNAFWNCEVRKLDETVRRGSVFASASSIVLKDGGIAVADFLVSLVHIGWSVLLRPETEGQESKWLAEGPSAFQFINSLSQGVMVGAGGVGSYTPRVSGGFLEINKLGVFDVTANDAAVIAQRGGFVSTTETLYGDGNDIGCSVTEGGRLLCRGDVPTVTGSSSELVFDFGTSHIPRLTPGGAVPAAAALATWANLTGNFAGGGNGAYVQGYTADAGLGSSITVTVNP